MTEQEEDEELLNESSTEEGPVVARFADSPSCKQLYYHADYNCLLVSVFLLMGLC